VNGKLSHPTLSRRGLLRLLAAAGITAAGGYVLSDYAPWLDYDEQANHIRRPFEKDTAVSVQMRELIRYATLAANGHNTQPWKFVIEQIEETQIRLQFQSAMGLGASLPQLLVRFGYAPSMPCSLRRPVEQVLAQS